MDRQHDSKGHVSPKSGVGDSRAIPPRALPDAITEIVAEIDHDRFAQSCHEPTCSDFAFRKGWNAASERIKKKLNVALGEHRLAIALAELRACDVDQPFALSGEGG